MDGETINSTIGVASKLARALKPPRDDDRAVMAWRWIVVGGILLNSLGLLIHILLACGLLSFFPGFAYADDVNLLKAQLKTTRIEQLEWRIFDIRIEQCAAIKKGQDPQVYTIQLQQLERTYTAVAGHAPTVANCDEVQ